MMETPKKERERSQKIFKGCESQKAEIRRFNGGNTF
jgi:hypothetical protein